jgi:CHAT domain-containing protein
VAANLVVAHRAADRAATARRRPPRRRRAGGVGPGGLFLHPDGADAHPRPHHQARWQVALVVGVDHAPGHPLGFAVEEAHAVAALLAAPTPPLIDTQATVGAVRTGLERAAWAHFACHGIAARDPGDSHLVLHDGPLPVREIANLDLPDARLAYLSACTTAFGGTTLLDESIHIASAFQVAGFAHVIATLWPITDTHAPHLARDVYAHLRNGHDPAHATHRAIHTLRTQLPRHPYLWAPYIHFGP